MDIRIRETGEILNEREFKRLYKKTSFANGVIPLAFIETHGGDVILEGPQPTGKWWQHSYRDGVEEINGKWYWKYSLGPTFASQEEENTYEAQKDSELHRGHEISVNEERAKRVLTGSTFTVNGKDIVLTGDQQTKDNLSDLAFAASLRKGQGNNNHVTVFRDGNNVDHELSPDEVIQLWSMAAAFVSNLYQKSWALKAMNPVPEDYKNDSYWS